MPTLVLKKNEARTPFFGEKMLATKGLDPLGLQFTSEATYSLLLPGLNNVTKRIRYYGFYCWLLDGYARLEGSTDPDRQCNFIRRAELLVALLMQSCAPEKIQIPGSSYAKARIAEHVGTHFDLIAGADLRASSNEGTYWKYRVGAFGQYYAGAMKTLGLIANNQDNPALFVRTQAPADQSNLVSGLRLAAAFAEHLPPAEEQAFLQAVQSGKLLKSSIPQLFNYFNLAEVTEDSTEQELYLQLLTTQDYPFRQEPEPPKHRAHSLRALLGFFAENNSSDWGDFLYQNYAQQAADWSGDATLTGWYYYQLNEYWQYACSGLLAAALGALAQEEYEQAYLADFVLGLATSAQSSLAGFINCSSASPTLTALLEMPLFDSEETYAQCMEEALVANKYPAAMANALALIGQLYHRNVAAFPNLKSYAQQQQLTREGNFIEFAESLATKKDLPLADFLRDFLYRHILFRHQYVAIRKMGNGQQSTLKFELEGVFIRLLDVTTPQFSGPRIDTLLGMAVDLGLFNPEFTLTPRGQELLAQ